MSETSRDTTECSMRKVVIVHAEKVRATVDSEIESSHPRRKTPEAPRKSARNSYTLLASGHGRGSGRLYQSPNHGGILLRRRQRDKNRLCEDLVGRLGGLCWTTRLREVAKGISRFQRYVLYQGFASRDPNLPPSSDVEAVTFLMKSHIPSHMGQAKMYPVHQPFLWPMA
jgi:hypothetical protein